MLHETPRPISLYSIQGGECCVRVYEFLKSWNWSCVCVCRCKSCIIRVKVSDGRTLCPINFVPYLSGNGKSSPLSMLCTQNRLLEFLKCSASTGSSYHGVGIIIKERGNWFFFHPNLHFKTWLMFKKDLDGFKHLWTWKTILFCQIRLKCTI